jgi:6-phosphofructokinase 1
VRTIHHVGGNYLGFYRSQENATAIVDRLVDKEINQLYVIGGVGTIKFCEVLHQEIKNRKLPIALCVIPKSITNDIPIIDKSFGF